MRKFFFIKIHIFLFLVLFIHLELHSQKQNFKTNYKLSICSGNPPKQFKISTLDKIKEDLNDRKASVEFYEKFRYSQQKVLFGGKVLFGDEMSVYVNKVAHNLLDKSGNSSLKEKLNFYVLKSDAVNALCMLDGSIFITVGLLSQIENEAQLAYIISHEITHYTKQHSVNDFSKEKKIAKKYKKEGISYKEAIKTLSNYTKDNELESDKVGFEMFKKAGYDSEEAINSLIVLQYSHLPFDEIKFNTSFFDRENYKIPKEYFKSTVKTEDIKDNSGKDDTYSTHPNIKNRINNLDKGKFVKGVTEFFSVEEFKYINLKARFENQYLHLLEKNFIKAIYESYLLKSNYPDNTYLDECIAKGLYGLSKFKTNDNFFKDYKDNFYGGSSKKSNVEGESLVLYELFEKMSKVEMNILALKIFNEIDGSEVYVEDLMLDLSKENHFDNKTFYNKHQLDSIYEVLDIPIIRIDTNNTDSTKVVVSPIKIMEFVEIDSLEYLKLSKVEKIEYSQKKKEYFDKIKRQKLVEDRINNQLKETNKNTKEEELDDSYYLFAFVNELEDSSFKNELIKADTNNNYRYFSNWYDNLEYKQRKKYNKKKRSENYSKSKLNIDSLIIVEPTYSKWDGRKKNTFFTKQSLYNKKEWKKSLKQSTESKDKNTINLAYTNSDSITIDKLNTQFILKEWHNEMIENSSYKMLPLSQERANNLFDSLGYSNVLLSGVISERVKSNPRILYGGIIYPLAPIFLIWYLKPKYQTYKYITIIDRNGYIVLSKYI